MDKELSTPVNNVQFTTDGAEQISGAEQGRLYLNPEGKMAFSGDVDATAKILFDSVVDMFNARLSR